MSRFHISKSLSIYPLMLMGLFASLLLIRCGGSSGGGGGGGGGGGTSLFPYTRSGTDIDITLSGSTPFDTAEEGLMANLLNNMPTPFLEPVKTITSNQEPNGLGVVYVPAGLSPATDCYAYLATGIGYNFYEYGLNSAEQTEWNNIVNAPSGVDPGMLFASTFNSWVDSSDNELWKGGVASGQAGDAVPLQIDLFIAALFANSSPEGVYFFNNFTQKNLASVTWSSSSLTLAVASGNTYVCALTVDGKNITSVAKNGATPVSVGTVPIPQLFLTDLPGDTASQASAEGVER